MFLRDHMFRKNAVSSTSLCAVACGLGFGGGSEFLGAEWLRLRNRGSVARSRSLDWRVYWWRAGLFALDLGYLDRFSSVKVFVHLIVAAAFVLDRNESVVRVAYGCVRLA